MILSPSIVSHTILPDACCACMRAKLLQPSDCAIYWTVAHQSPLSVGFSRQELWSGLPCTPLGDLPDLSIEPISLMSLALAGRFFTTSLTWEGPVAWYLVTNTQSVLKILTSALL